jgi:hypothetical protein
VPPPSIASQREGREGRVERGGGWRVDDTYMTWALTSITYIYLFRCTYDYNIYTYNYNHNYNYTYLACADPDDKDLGE